MLSSSSDLRFELIPWVEARSWWHQLLQFGDLQLYHRQPWIELLHQVYRYRIWVANLKSGGQTVASTIVAQSGLPWSRRLISLPGSDVCPPLAWDRHYADQLIQSLVSIRESAGGCELRGVAAAPPWQVVSCYSGWEVELDRPYRTIERSIHGGFRRLVGRATRTVVLDRGESVAELRRFYILHLRTRRRQGMPVQPFTFFKKTLELLAGDLEIWIARTGSVDQAAIILIKSGDRLYYKWGARADQPVPGASHLLLANAMRQYAVSYRIFDLGRTDSRNEGLVRFKRELGAKPVPMPYSFYPKAPSQVSAEVPTQGRRKLASKILQRMPLIATRIAGGLIYRYLA